MFRLSAYAFILSWGLTVVGCTAWREGRPQGDDSSQSENPVIDDSDGGASGGSDNESPPTSGSGGRVSVVIDERILPSQPTVPGIGGGPERPVGVMVGPKGVPEEFVVDEVMFHPENEEDLQAFLSQYDGTVVRDGSFSDIPEELRVHEVPPAVWYLIRVNLQQSSLVDLAANVEATGINGELRFSSEDAARLASLVARESGRGVSPNFLLYAQSVLEHPDAFSGNLDAETWPWMTEGDEGVPGDPGLSVGVIHAWKYLKYMNIPPTPPPGGSAFWEPVVVAVIDSGFALDEETGVPLGGNLDYYNSFDAPLQADIVDHDGAHAGGASSIPTNIGGVSPWHGQEAFGVCCAYPRNLYGGAGIGGPVAKPLLIRTGDTVYAMHDAIFAAAILGADVVTISMGGECSTLCDIADFFADNGLQSAVGVAVSFDAVVLAGAGNVIARYDPATGQVTSGPGDISGRDIIPCKLNNVICVGSVDYSKNNLRNYGGGVDIWAPERVYSTVTPDDAAVDADNLAEDVDGDGTIDDELSLFAGTSAATPFVAGVVALMRALGPGLRWSQVQDILQRTANPSEDSDVAHGYVDAYEAVKAVMPNRPPAVRITRPADGATLAWSSITFGAEVADPEPGARSEDVAVVFSSDEDGDQPCTGAGVFKECQKRLLYLGSRVITATATDPFGAQATDAITVNVIDTPPTVNLLEPAEGATFYSHQPIHFGAYIYDPDESPFPPSSVSWNSSLDGDLIISGWSIDAFLSVGTHVVTVTAEDTHLNVAQDSITVNVLSGAGYPSATILEPADGATFLPGTRVTFRAEGTDPEDGPLPGTRFAWYRGTGRLAVLLGTGATIQATLAGPATPCNPEFVTYTITLLVTDSDGHQVSYHVNVRVGSIC